mmetsp:Transcript_12672/g.14538  ORF Transcript_12672/g.14538 Transcript_12672/m.14538 type:complete len:244 (+) Transcript_12672:477-1208(+)
MTPASTPRKRKQSFSVRKCPKSFAVHISKDYFKFNAAHFIAMKGYREKLHGHNYRLELKIWGRKNSDGYVLDFGKIKTVLRGICKNINEHVIIPSLSDVLKILDNGKQVNVECEDESCFSFPADDCILLPIEHSSAEELAEYILQKTVESFSVEYLINERGVTAMELFVSEAPSQSASCRIDFIESLPTYPEGKRLHMSSDTNQFIANERSRVNKSSSVVRRQVQPCLLKNELKPQKLCCSLK